MESSLDLSPTQVCFSYFSRWEERRATKSLRHRMVSALPHTGTLLLCPYCQLPSRALRIWQDKPILSKCCISFRNRIVPSKEQGSCVSGVTQDFIAAGTIHVQLTGKQCEAKWELLTAFGMTQCFTMRKQRLLWSTQCRRVRSLKSVQVITSSGLSEIHARDI